MDYVMNPLRKLVKKHAPYLDGLDAIVGLVLFGTIALTYKYNWLTVSVTIAVATAAGVFIAVYRRRHGEKQVPAVRQTFFKHYDNSHDFGLKNYGPGAALYLQLVVTDGNKEEIFSLDPLEDPLHLEKGDTLGFVYDDRRPDDGLREWLKGLDEVAKKNDPEVELHYSYVSDAGTREPGILNGTTERPDEKIDGLKDVSNSPRRMKVTILHEEYEGSSWL